VVYCQKFRWVYTRNEAPSSECRKSEDRGAERRGILADGCPPSQGLRSLGECRELPQWGPGPPTHSRHISVKGVGTAGATGALAPAMLKLRGRKYLFAPAIICQVYQLVDSPTSKSLYSFKILKMKTTKTIAATRLSMQNASCPAVHVLAIHL